MVFELRPLLPPHTQHSEADTPLKTAVARNTWLLLSLVVSQREELSSWKLARFQCFSSCPQLPIAGGKSQESTVKRWELPPFTKLLLVELRLLQWSVTNREACHCSHSQLQS